MALWGSLIGIVALLCAIWVIYDVVVNHKKWKSSRKAVWIIFAVLFSIITAIVYLLVDKKR